MLQNVLLFVLQCCRTCCCLCCSAAEPVAICVAVLQNLSLFVLQCCRMCCCLCCSAAERVVICVAVLQNVLRKQAADMMTAKNKTKEILKGWIIKVSFVLYFCACVASAVFTYPLAVAVRISHSMAPSVS